MSKWEDMGREYRVPASIVRYVTSILEDAGFPQDECRSGKIWAVAQKRSFAKAKR